MKSVTDVIVVGGGNAGFSAALAARERGRQVVLLEKGSGISAGGNSFFTAGAFRIPHHGLEDLVDIIDADDRFGHTVLPEYTEVDFRGDMRKVTDDQNDKELTEVLVTSALDTIRWLRSHGVHFRLMYERQAYPDSDGVFRFWGGLSVGVVGGGAGLIAAHTRIAEKLDISVRYATRAVSLIVENGTVVGVNWESNGEHGQTRADSVILAAGGFEASETLRGRYLGEEWKRAKLRGTPHNTGEMLEAALSIGAAPYGDWTTCHSVAWDATAPENESNWELTNRLTRSGYPLGIMVDREGRRFVDEGADFRNYTYAKYGAAILRQSSGVAFQIFDSSIHPMLRAEEYDMPGISVVIDDSLESLATAAGIDARAFAHTVEEFNASIDQDAVFNPSIKDGRFADTRPPKSNWANPLETPPFYAYPVTCGITFTFGGLHSSGDGEVLDTDGKTIPGLFVCGEMLGGLFSGNYPGGSGLTSGSVFGRRAGSKA